MKDFIGHEFIEIWMKDVIHQSAECSRGVGQSKGITKYS